MVDPLLGEKQAVKDKNSEHRNSGRVTTLGKFVALTSWEKKAAFNARHGAGFFHLLSHVLTHNPMSSLKKRERN